MHDVCSFVYMYSSTQLCDPLPSFQLTLSFPLFFQLTYIPLSCVPFHLKSPFSLSSTPPPSSNAEQRPPPPLCVSSFHLFLFPSATTLNLCSSIRLPLSFFSFFHYPILLPHPFQPPSNVEHT